MHGYDVAMSQFVKVKHTESGAFGEVPEAALQFWLGRGYEQVDPDAPQAQPPATGTENAGGQPPTTEGASDDNTHQDTENPGQ